jgi:hypothetical protein
LIESLLLCASANDNARERIFGEILACRPASVVHLGDVVSLGFYDRTWGSFDAFRILAASEGVKVFGVPGNHEVMFLPATGEQNFQTRFPEYRRTGFLVRAGNLGIVLLNSNFETLSGAEQLVQQEWYKQTLSRMDADTSIGAVIVCCHHAPFTNSTVVMPSEEVQARFVKPFLRSAKARGLLSGHAHACEHFVQAGKDFLVIGGGGGLLHPLLQGSAARWIDRSPLTTERRPFHYLACRIRPDGCVLSVRVLRQDCSGFDDVDPLFVPFAGGAGNPPERMPVDTLKGEN